MQGRWEMGQMKKNKTKQKAEFLGMTDKSMFLFIMKNLTDYTYWLTLFLYTSLCPFLLEIPLRAKTWFQVLTHRDRMTVAQTKQWIKATCYNCRGWQSFTDPVFLPVMSFLCTKIKFFYNILTEALLKAEEYGLCNKCPYTHPCPPAVWTGNFA